MHLLKIKAHAEIHSDDSWECGLYGGLEPPSLPYLLSMIIYFKKTNQSSKSAIVDDRPLIEAWAWILN